VDLLRRISKYGSVGLAQELRQSSSCFYRLWPTLRVSWAWGQDPGFEVESTLRITRNSEFVDQGPVHSWAGQPSQVKLGG
jgi:hypothetical protein